jgi:predicted dehydrogenase
MQKLRIGLVGLGFMGATHLEVYPRISELELAAVCTRDERVLSGDLSHIRGNFRVSTALDFSHAHKYRVWQELVEDSNLDAIDVCTPTDLHTPITLAALKAGKHVLCEKPMALSEAECNQMIAAAKESHRVLMIGQVLRFWPEYEYLQEFVQSGTYGSVLSATFWRSCGLPDWSSWLTVEERSGGAILDLLIHDIDQMILLFGLPRAVSAKRLGGIDGLTATLLYRNGPEVRIQGGWFESGTPLRMGFQVRAERAELCLDASGLRLNDVSGKSRAIELSKVHAFEREISYFVACCNQGQWPDRCPPEESRMAVKLALALRESRSKEGEHISCSA